MESSQEAANVAQVKSYHLGRWTVVLAIIQIVLTIYSIWPTQNQGGTFMLKGWLPTVLLLANTAITAVVLLFFAIKLRQTKRLAKERISLKANLSEATTKLLQQDDAVAKADSLLDEKQKLGEALSRSGSEITHCKRQLGEAQETIRQLENGKRDLTNENIKLGHELVTVKKDKHALEQSFETSQHELSEVRTNAQAQEETYKLEHKTILIGKNMLEEDLKEAQKALKEETKRANYESNQREEFIKLYHYCPNVC
jgi:hypothetical protein